MEYYKITHQLVKYVDSIFLWSAYSHIRMLMEDMGLGVHRGIILYVPNHNQAERVISNFELCGAVRGRIRGQKLPSTLNSKLVIVDCQAHYKKEHIYEFLNCSDYFPILIVAGKLPNWIHEDNYPNLLFIETIDDCAELEVEFGKNQATILKNFMDFSHDHTDMLVKFLSSIKQRAWFKGIADRRQIYKALFCIGKVFEFHVQMACTGIDLPDDFNNYLDGIICESLDFEDYEMNMVSDFYKALVRYLDCEKQIPLGSIDEIQGNLIKAVAEEQAVLYDDKFYYMSDKLFGQIVKTMKYEISSRSLKLILLQEQVLVCNNTRDNYSVKKILTTACGESIRVRLLKFNREQLEAGEELSLIERGKLYAYRAM